MEIIKSAAWFIVAIGVLVAFHEFGHFWVARRLGVKVLRYSVGFGRPLFIHRGRDGCEYALSAIPLGGYVKMLDEREGPVDANERARAFNTQPPWKRFAIVAAGPIANLLAAILLFWAVWVVGQPGLVPALETPPKASIAAAAGLQRGAVIDAVDGEAVSTWNSLRTVLLEAAVERRSVRLTVRESLDANAAVREVELPLASVRMDPEHLFLDLGLSPYQPSIPALIESVESGSPAAEAGLQAGDRLIERGGEPIADWLSWASWVRAHPGALVEVRYQRGSETRATQMIVAGVGEGEQRMGRVGVRVAIPEQLFARLRAEDRLSPTAAIPAALAQTGRMSMLTLRMLGRMFTGEVSVKNISGPIGTAEAAGLTAKAGLAAFLSFMALVSVSLAVLNLLPVPVLDGGHLVFYAIEMLRGAPLPDKAMEIGQRVGISLLVLLMGLAFYNDLSRLVG